VGVAQLVELLVVVQAVAGSSPVAHPSRSPRYGETKPPLVWGVGLFAGTTNRPSDRSFVWSVGRSGEEISELPKPPFLWQFDSSSEASTFVEASSPT
jgi:hypothetical protein